jgi:hypothetical protein
MDHFNFRHVRDAVGIESSNENNWAIGQLLSSMAAKRGIPPAHILAEKTDPNPTVAAPHCIAHYPAWLFDDAVEAVKVWWGDKERQLGFDL